MHEVAPTPFQANILKQHNYGHLQKQKRVIQTERNLCKIEERNTIGQTRSKD